MLVLDRGRGTSAAEGARIGGGDRGGDGVSGLGGDSGLCWGVMCALAGIVIGGRRGRCSAGLPVVVFSRGRAVADSEVEGRPSVTEMTTPLFMPDGLIISNSGSPAGGLVVYREILIFRAGKCFRREAIGPSWSGGSVAMIKVAGSRRMKTKN